MKTRCSLPTQHGAPCRTSSWRPSAVSRWAAAQRRMLGGVPSFLACTPERAGPVSAGGERSQGGPPGVGRQCAGTSDLLPGGSVFVIPSLGSKAKPSSHSGLSEVGIHASTPQPREPWEPREPRELCQPWEPREPWETWALCAGRGSPASGRLRLPRGGSPMRLPVLSEQRDSLSSVRPHGREGDSAAHPSPSSADLPGPQGTLEQ